MVAQGFSVVIEAQKTRPARHGREGIAPGVAGADVDVDVRAAVVGAKKKGPPRLTWSSLN
jgi:F420-0:gamma-glutamyl ligase